MKATLILDLITAQEIVLFLANTHRMYIISLRHLKRILRRLGCRKRWFQSDLDEIVVVVQEELKGSEVFLEFSEGILGF